MLWLTAFFGTMLAHYLSAVWGIKDWYATRRLDTWACVRWSVLLLCLGWVDYLTADRMSLSAAFPGSLIGIAAGTYRAVEARKIQKRLRKKRKLAEQGENVPQGPE